jgi:hypothetical protein
MAFKKNDVVRLKAHIIEGGVEEIKYNDSTEELEYRVVYDDQDNVSQTRWFTESQLEIVV